MALSLGATGGHNPNKDVEVNSPPDDGISSLAFSPKANYLIASSWDSKVRCWEVQSNGNTVPKKMYQHEAPVLSACWSADGTRIFSGGCDNKAKVYSLGTDQIMQLGQHNAPIKHVFWIEDMQCLLTGSWDKTLKYWDGRSPNAASSIDLPERLYCMDISFPLAVAGTAERHVIIYDLRRPTVEFKRFASPLKFQSRVISCFPDKTGFALGSIEGRVAIHHVDDKDTSKNFAFKCHREGNEVYAVNSIAFHPGFGTFATTGSDGTFNFWDKDSKQRLKPFNKCNAPIPCGVFNHDGSIFAYAVSYDWSKGVEFYNPHQKNYILLHPTTEAEIKHRDGNRKR
jgi:mRNA export factor